MARFLRVELSFPRLQRRPMTPQIQTGLNYSLSLGSSNPRKLILGECFPTYFPELIGFHEHGGINASSQSKRPNFHKSFLSKRWSTLRLGQ
jgi:hypothetical protein